MDKIVLGIFLSTILGTFVFAQGNNGILVVHAWVQAPGPDEKMTEAYLDITNNTPDPIVLVSVKTPWAETVEIHQQISYKGFLKVVAVHGIAILPGRTLQLEPKGGYLELIHLSKTLHGGDQGALTLSFQDGSTVLVHALVKPQSA